MNQEQAYCKILRDLREDHDLNQSVLADLLHTTQQVYSRYETGVHGLPIRHMITLCRFYHVSADYILGLTTDPRPYGWDET